MLQQLDLKQLEAQQKKLYGTLPICLILTSPYNETMLTVRSTR
jgi:hypothetical protein